MARVLIGAHKSGVKQVADEMHEGLRRYLEAQYHIKDTGLIEERRVLLQERGTISQEPFIETTPSYQQGVPYFALGLPSPVGETLSELAGWNPGIGVFPKPYVHQAEALQAFLHEGRDVIVATGTGSGKTEAFLFPLLGQLLLEGAQRPKSFAMPGFRALLLYPMNALVADQVSRLRRLFGDIRLSDLFKSRYGRFPRFGMYTGRTPYPGVRESSKDQRHMRAVLKYYVDLETDETGDKKDREERRRLVEELKRRGRWPAKDVLRFYGEDGARWENRLKTQPDDRELLMRQEMQVSCPDILVTNYSMLEYMLLRPIERNIFKQTQEWLASDQNNKVILVLDEAHMYRGAGGAEVGLLIRRLQARLGIKRDRLRCMLTSASLGRGEEAERAVKEFAVGLTGHPESDPMPYRLIRGTREKRPEGRPGTVVETRALAHFDLTSFMRRVEAPEQALRAIGELAAALQWAPPPSGAPSVEEIKEWEGSAEGEESSGSGGTEVSRYLYRTLEGFGPLELLIEMTSGNAVALNELSLMLFPSVEADEAESATASLLAIGTYAHNGIRTLLPTRVHLFFRGLPALYACINSSCDRRRYKPGEKLLLGRLYTEPRTHCDCSVRARVYELYTHRDCGAAFLRVFSRGDDRTFYWHEKGGTVDPESTFTEDLLLAEEEPHQQMGTKVEAIWVEMTTGRVVDAPPTQLEERYRRLWRGIRQEEANSTGKKKAKKEENGDGVEEGSGEQLAYTQCPVCTKRTVHKIMDLGTVGEAPFANLVRTQFEQQPLEKQADAHYPNGGRKVLLFSDGRQKAARLARDLPRAVEFDSFRQALALSIKRLNALEKEATLDDRLYLAFVSVCSDFHLHFFDQENRSQEKLLDDMKRFEHFYADLDEALEDGERLEAPARYKYALLRQLSDPFYSIYAACAAVTKPTKRAVKMLQKVLSNLPEEFLKNELEMVATMWIQALLERGAFDGGISEEMRRLVMEYYKPVSGIDKNTKLEKILKEAGKLGDADVKNIQERLYEVLTERSADGHVYLKPDMLKLELALEDNWLQCNACSLTQHKAVFGCCANCGSKELIEQAPDSPYMSARKAYFREPLRAVLKGERPTHIVAEEHTAQLSQRDAGVVYATTEEYELRFQDILLQDPERKGEYKPPVDVLSCTTTMEVGIDIGSLTAIGLRNVPPQRENYQQRAGRSGRRGVAISTVQTYAQGGPHDNFYYEHPREIISGEPRKPRVKINNRRLAQRHVHSYLVQTFFQQQLDSMSSDEQEALAGGRTNLMSALGPAQDFFGRNGRFTLASMKTWIEESSKVGLLDRIAEWLPDEICISDVRDESAIRTEKQQFAARVAADFVRELEGLRGKFRNQNGQGESEVNGFAVGIDAPLESDAVGELELNRNMLINVLFDAGLLPSYAFPTDLCSFYVFAEEGGRVRIKERPQQSKQQALSEYAPGRLLVINKQTYRVGGIYTEGAKTAEPAKGLFARPLDKYVYCPLCLYVRLNSERKAHELCPVCETPLEEYELLDPPGFSPVRGRPLNERDRDQEITYATSAQLPTPVETDKFNWEARVGKHMRHTYEENRQLIVVNQGPSGQGFRVCASCGAAWPTTQEQTIGKHRRPFMVDWFILKNEGLSYQCNGPLHPAPLYLGHGFRTDLLVARIDFSSPMAFNARHPWLHDSLRAVAEALALAASRQLDIDPGELSAGFRLMPPVIEEDYSAKGNADIFLYDTASGGAGYAAEAGAMLPQVLQGALSLLEGCPAQCERSCTKCLRHYGNRYWHEALDRHLGAQLLGYLYYGRAPVIASSELQRRQLVGLQRYLELEGWETDAGVSLGGAEVPLVVREPESGKRVAIGTYPAMLDEDDEIDHPLRRVVGGGTRVVLLRDYMVVRDLPAAFEAMLNEAKLGR